VAIIYSAWQAANNGQEELHNFRSDKIKNRSVREEIINQWKTIPKCVLITSRHTMPSRTGEEVIWQRQALRRPQKAL
jgi:hypothetical protein